MPRDPWCCLQSYLFYEPALCLLSHWEKRTCTSITFPSVLRSLFLERDQAADTQSVNTHSPFVMLSPASPRTWRVFMLVQWLQQLGFPRCGPHFCGRSAPGLETGVGTPHVCPGDLLLVRARLLHQKCWGCAAAAVGSLISHLSTRRSEHPYINE